MERQWIHVHIGQAGVQVGKEFWKIYSLDNGVRLDGSVVENRKNECTLSDENLKAIYEETSIGKFKPRALFLDTEPTAIDAVLKQDDFSKCISSSQVGTMKEGAGSIFSRGYHTLGKELLDTSASNLFRKQVEACDLFEGIVVTNSICGGTGSGFASLFLRHIGEEYKNVNVINHIIVPSSDQSNLVTAPYNAILYLGNQLNRSKEFSGHRVVTCYDNQKMYDFLGQHISSKYEDVNRLIGHVSSSMFSSFLFNNNDNGSHIDLSSSIQRIFPRGPSFNYFVPSLFLHHNHPVSEEEEEEEKGESESVLSRTIGRLFDSSSSSLLNIDPLTTKFHTGGYEDTRFIRKKKRGKYFEPHIDIDRMKHKLTDRRKINARKGKFYQSRKKNSYFTNLLMFRSGGGGGGGGEEKSKNTGFSSRDVVHSISKLVEKKSGEYNFGNVYRDYTYSFCNKYFPHQRIISKEEVQKIDHSGCMLSNCDSIKHSLRRTISKFNTMYAFRSFCWWFVGEGGEESEFGFALQEVRNYLDELEELTIKMDEEENSDEEEED